MVGNPLCQDPRAYGGGPPGSYLTFGFEGAVKLLTGVGKDGSLFGEGI